MLLKKARRAIWENKKSYLACIFLIALGILFYTAMGGAVEGLEQSKNDFYRDYGMGDVFASVEAMPMNYAQSLTELDGVAAVTPRYVLETRAEVPGREETLTLRLVSYDPEEDGRLCNLLVTGQWPEENWEFILDPSLFQAYGMELGSQVSLFVRGREFVYSVTATALSPEYVYISKSEKEVFPDPLRYGVAFVPQESLSAMTGIHFMANDLVIQLSPGYVLEDVRTELEDRLAPYGLRTLLDKEDQLSYAYLDMEITSLRSMSSAMPMLFILIAVAVLYLMMKRVIEQERVQIGTLKALGYSNGSIMLHYLSYGGLTGIVGGVAGCVLGSMVSGVYLELFLEFFSLPAPDAAFHSQNLFSAMLWAVGGGLLGAMMGAIKALRLEPAESMRPESPKPVRHAVFGQGKVIRMLFTSRGMMALRSMSRAPLRSGFVAMGIMLSFSILCISGSMNSIIDKMILSQFTLIQRYGVKISLTQPLPVSDALEAAYAINGVTQAQGLLEVPVELKRGNLKQGLVLFGVPADGTLYRICDTNTAQSYAPPADGVILSNAVASQLDVRAGDTVYLSSPLLHDDIALPVVRVIEQNLGTGAYMELEAVSALFQQGAIASSILLNTDDLAHLKEYLKNSPQTAAIDDVESTLQSYQETLSMYEGIYLGLEAVGAAVGFAIIYNTATIALSERKREYATLRVLGLSVGEVSGIMNLEYTMLGVAGMLLGIPCALLLNNAMNWMVDISMFNMPSTLPLSALITGFAGCSIAILLSGLSARRKIQKFDLVEVLKQRE